MELLKKINQAKRKILKIYKNKVNKNNLKNNLLKKLKCNRNFKKKIKIFKNKDNNNNINIKKNNRKYLLTCDKKMMKI